MNFKIINKLIFFCFIILLASVNFAQENVLEQNSDHSLTKNGEYRLFAGSNNNGLRNLLYKYSSFDAGKNPLIANKEINTLSTKIELASGSTKAGLISGLFIGYGLPFSPLKGITTTISVKNTTTHVTSYFVKYGITGGLSEKLPIGKKGNIRLVMDLSYSYFFQSGSDSAGLYTIKPKMQIFQIGLGGEYAFPSFDSFEPFVGVEATGNIFGGSMQFLNNATGIDTVNDLNMVTRYGVTFGAGMNYAINKNIGFVFGAKYNICNLIGRSSDLNGARELNDAAYTLNGSNISAKTISFMSFYVGLSVYLGSASREIPW